jgi:myo-inositol-1(or 4)-monophosphatase
MELTSEDLLQTARRAAVRAAKPIMRSFREGIEVLAKAEGQGTYNLVTTADHAAEAVIVEYLRDAYPAHEILGEESASGAIDAEHLWIVDPIDGTNNFAHGLPHFAISIAYWQQGQPTVGVVYNPAREDWYCAIRGSGAFHNQRRMQVGPQRRLSEVLIGTGFYYDRGAMMRATLDAIAELFGHQIHGIRRFGTASLDLCQVAAGQFGAYFEYQLNPWDFAAGQLIVQEAGGQVTNCLGLPPVLGPTSLLASNGVLHRDVLAVVGEHYRRLISR